MVELKIKDIPEPELWDSVKSYYEDGKLNLQSSTTFDDIIIKRIEQRLEMLQNRT